MRVVFEMAKSTLATAGATLNDMVQIHLCLYDLSDFEGTTEVLNKYFDKDCFSVRITPSSEFPEKECCV